MKNLDELKLSFPEMDEIEKRSTKGGCNDPDGIYYHPKHVQQWLLEFGKDCDPKGLTYLGGTLKEVEITGKKPTQPSPSPYGYPIFDPFGAQIDQPPVFPYRPGGGRDDGRTVPTSQMTASDKLREFLHPGEEFRASVYSKDGNNSNNPTIGYGHKLTKAEIANGTFANKSITTEEALAIYKEDINMAISAVQHKIKVNLSQNQFDAMVSFAFQQGYGNFSTSDVTLLINEGRLDNAMQALRNLTKDHTDGRYHRHNEEADLFIYGDYTFEPYK